MYITGVHQNSPQYFEPPQNLYSGSTSCTNNTYAVIIVLNIPSDLESSSAMGLRQSYTKMAEQKVKSRSENGIHLES